MKKDDLTKVRYIGAARMKQLYASGITTFKQLHETPPGRLAQINNIGKHYAEKIQKAVADVYTPPVEQPAKKGKETSKQKAAKPNKKLQKKIKRLDTNLKKGKKGLQSLGRKNQKIVAGYKKRAKKLKQHAGKLDTLDKKLPQKVAQKLGKKADALTAALKKAGQAPKKKRYQHLSEELRSFDKTLRNAISRQ